MISEVKEGKVSKEIPVDLLPFAFDQDLEDVPVRLLDNKREPTATVM